MKPDLFAGQILTARDVERFVYGGRALFTIVSRASGNRFTFKVSSGTNKKNKNLMFVHVLSGPDNTTSYSYLGYLMTNNRKKLMAGQKGKPDAVSFKALDWLIKQLASSRLPESVEFYHSGKCGCCGRTLTVPESIKTGLGPVCAGRQK